MGIGGAFVETAGYGVIMSAFKEQRGKVMAASETIVGLGVIAGPPLGGLMYQLGGGSTRIGSLTEGDFTLPCAVFAAFPLALLLVLPFCIPAHSVDSTSVDLGDRPTADEGSGSKDGFGGVLTSLPFLITLVGVFLSAAGLGTDRGA